MGWNTTRRMQKRNNREEWVRHHFPLQFLCEYILKSRKRKPEGDERVVQEERLRPRVSTQHVHLRKTQKDDLRKSLKEAKSREVPRRDGLLQKKRGSPTLLPVAVKRRENSRPIRQKTRLEEKSLPHRVLEGFQGNQTTKNRVNKK